VSAGENRKSREPTKLNTDLLEEGDKKFVGGGGGEWGEAFYPTTVYIEKRREKREITTSYQEV